MKRFFEHAKNGALTLPINIYSVAVFSLLLVGLSFAINIASLTFYLDDWPKIYSYVVHGAEGIKTYWTYDDRPYGWWTDLLLFKIWGTNPIFWHLSTYLFRWFVGLGVWGVFSLIWPFNKREVFWVVLLFSVYPLFNQQSMGVTFNYLWICYVLFFLSMYLMVLAVKKPKYKLVLLAASLLVNIPSLFTQEYYIGIEFIRPLILWLAMDDKPARYRLKRVLSFWSPFLLTAIFYIIWRVFLMENIRGLDPDFFTYLAKSPLSTLLQLINFILRDALHVVLGVWTPTVDPANIDITVPSKLFGMILTALAAGSLSFFFLRESKRTSETANSPQKTFLFQSTTIGIIGILLGCLPGWLVMRSVSSDSGIWNDRFGLAGMWAAALFIVGVLSYLFKEHRLRREIIFVALIGLAVGHNYLVTNDYKWSSTWQKRFFSQLYWRAPYIESQTSIISANELFPKMGVYPTSYALNLLYPTVQPFPLLDYWFYPLQKYFPNNVSQMAEGMPLSAMKWYSEYEADSRNSLVINWATGNAHCLWMLSSNDRYNPLLDTNTRLALPASNLDRIVDADNSVMQNPLAFGGEEAHGWCYYYETADLARQFQRWDKVIELYEEAKNLNLDPGNGIELMPFIEGYAHMGDLDKAMQLTIDAKSRNEDMRNFLCDNWNRIAKDIDLNPSSNSTFNEFNQEERCFELIQ